MDRESVVEWLLLTYRKFENVVKPPISIVTVVNHSTYVLNVMQRTVMQSIISRTSNNKFNVCKMRFYSDYCMLISLYLVVFDQNCFVLPWL